MIKVLVVEDSPVIQDLLVYTINSDPLLIVVGTAKDGEEAIKMVDEVRPDVITMDIHMPKMDGITTTRKIMETIPTPIIIVSSTFINGEVSRTFHAMEAGALAILHRPSGIGHPDFQATSFELINTIKLMSEIKVVRRWPRYQKQSDSKTLRSTLTDITFQEKRIEKGAYQVIAIGASTGGPVVLQTILSGLGKEFPVPILIVQHIAKGFLQGFTEWLSLSCELPIHVAAHRELLTPGNVYVAPDGFHMGVDSSKRLILSKDEPEYSLRPAVSFLFRSVANAYGSNSIGVLLTGMGKDGAKELKTMKDAGAVTIAQNAESSVVHGMPGEAILLDAATHILPPEKIITTLKMLTSNHDSKL